MITSKNAQVPQIYGEFSIYAKRLVLYTGIIQHDLSKIVPDEVWRMGHSAIEASGNPEVNWKIRAELSDIATRYIQDFLKRKDVRIVL